jgi:hypothetical protein
MKNVSRIVALCALAALYAPAAAAQTPSASPASPAPSAQDQAAKTALYERWLNNRKNTDVAAQKTAYEAGKEYLTKYGADADQYVQAVQRWVKLYEDAAAAFERKKKFDEILGQIGTTKNYAGLFAAGKDVLAAEPDNFAVVLTLSNAGAVNAADENGGDQSLYPDAVRLTRLLAEQVAAGKGTPEQLMLVNSAAGKDDALGWLSYRLGLLTKESSPDEAATHLLKAAQTNGPAKSEPSLYYYLGQAYTAGDYKKLAADYKTRFEGREATDESRLALARLNQSLDRVLDAYARAVALSTKSDAKTQKFKEQLTAQLTDIYKQRHGSDAGIQQFIQGSAARRLPLPTDPVPAPEPAATPAATTTPATTPTPTPTPRP